MAQQEYLIKLAKREATIPMFDMSMNQIKINRRDAEIAALDTLIAHHAKKKEENEDFNLCTDLSRQLENLEDDQNWKIVQADLNILRSGFKESAKNDARPMIWVKLKELFDQLENPEKIVKKPEKKE